MYFNITLDKAVRRRILTSSDTDDSSLVKIHWKNLATNNSINIKYNILHIIIAMERTEKCFTSYNTVHVPSCFVA